MMLSGPAAVMTPHTPCFLVLVMLMMMSIMIIIIIKVVVVERRGMEKQSFLRDTFQGLSDLVIL